MARYLVPLSCNSSRTAARLKLLPTHRQNHQHYHFADETNAIYHSCYNCRAVSILTLLAPEAAIA